MLFAQSMAHKMPSRQQLRALLPVPSLCLMPGLPGKGGAETLLTWTENQKKNK